MKEDFYIGWSGRAPSEYASKAIIFFATVLIGMLLVAITFVINQRGYIDSNYDYGNLQEVSGYLIEHPVWGLRVEEGKDIKTIPLVGFGKMGPQATLNEMVAQHDLKEGTMITLRGMITRYQGRYLMELTEGKNSLVSASGFKVLDRDIQAKGYATLEGEIVDPKCFFGVMNPATKSIHRSCAIRCIAGGMPPLLAIRENGNFVDYYFIHGENMQSINKFLLPYVGVPVKLSGQVAHYDDWKALMVNEKDVRISFNQKKAGSLVLSICK